jgi:AAA15 family ATPase/GTPase
MLQKVSIQNFKSLKDVTLELQKVNLLIGPNNSGKSNFLKALESFGKYICFQHEENRFVKNVNDLQYFSFKKKIDSLQFELYFNNESIGCKISSSGDGSSDVDYRILFNNEIFPREFSDSFNRNTIEANIFNDDARRFIRKLEREVLENIKIYNIVPFFLVKSSSLNQDVSITQSASNLVSFLDNIKEEHPSIFNKIEKDLNKCIPEFKHITLPKTKAENGYIEKKIKLLDKDENGFWADEVSEGVLYFLALLCIVHQPNPPKLLLLEEPEKGIHPRRIREVMDFIFQLAEDKDIQVIMTTHSERVLDEFEDIPEAVFVFDKDEEGATQVKNLLKDIIEPSNEKMDANNLPRIKFVESLGSHWVTGFIGGVPR